MYSLHGGVAVTNITMKSSQDQTSVFGNLFNSSNSSIADGTYTFRVYANDTSGNNNYTEFKTFTFSNVVGTPVSACTNITSSGTYTLTQGVDASSYTGKACINIFADNVVFGGLGNTITFGSTFVSQSKAIVVQSVQNVTIKNIKLVHNGVIVNNQGISATGVYNLTITNSTINAYTPLTLNSVNNSIIFNNSLDSLLSSVVYGSSIFSNLYYSNISSNYFRYGAPAVSFQGQHNQLYDNLIDSAKQDGIIINSGSLNNSFNGGSINFGTDVAPTHPDGIYLSASGEVVC